MPLHDRLLASLDPLRVELRLARQHLHRLAGPGHQRALDAAFTDTEERRETTALALARGYGSWKAFHDAGARHFVFCPATAGAAAGITTVSSQELAEQFNLNSAQIRKDLGYFGEFGVRGVGYFIDDLRKHLTKILGLDKRQIASGRRFDRG